MYKIRGLFIYFYLTSVLFKELIKRSLYLFVLFKILSVLPLVLFKLSSFRNMHKYDVTLKKVQQTVMFLKLFTVVVYLFTRFSN